MKFQNSTPYRIDYEDGATPRDALGRVKRRIERVGAAAAQTTDYLYDDKGRLWKVNNGVAEYRYDKNGNRTYAKNSEGLIDETPGNIIYNFQDQLKKYGSTTFEYSPKGDVSVKTTPSGTFRYDYDAAGGLRFVALPNGSTIEYVLDGFGRRVGKKLNNQLKKQWVYGQGLGPVAELDGAGVVTMRFVYASKPNVPDFVKVYATNKLYRVFSDQLGTPRAIHDVTAGTTFTPRFDEFGIKLSDNTPFEIPFGFAGGLYDPDTKLTRFGARDYDASIGRWVSKDPILFGGGQANLYTYVENDPVNATDPSGLRIMANLRNPVFEWMNEQADAWYMIAGENWLCGDKLAAVGPAAMGAFVELFPYALETILLQVPVGVVTRIERHGPPPVFQRHAHGLTGSRKGKGLPYAINENGSAHDGNYTRIPKADIRTLRGKGFTVPDDGGRY